MIREKDIYDERQLQIHGKIYKRGFYIISVLLALNAILSTRGIIWAPIFEQNIIILMLASTIIEIEALIRGVYFGKNNKGLVFLFIIGITVGLIANLFIGTEEIRTDDNEYLLSQNMTFSILLILMTIYLIVGLIQFIRYKNSEKEGVSDDE